MLPLKQTIPTPQKPTPPVVTKPPIARPKALSLLEKKDNGPAILIYGESGTGKTYTIVTMLEAGERVLLVSTDFGGSGAETIVNALSDKPELLENCREIVLTSADEVEEFLDAPLKFVPDLWEFNPTVTYWDGFSNFQTNLVQDRVGELTDHRKAENTSEARAEGYVLETQDWGMVAKLSLKCLSDFLVLKNPTTGKFPIRVVSCLMDVSMKSTGGKQEIVFSKKPYLQGKTKLLANAGFSLVIQTKVSSETDASKREYTYLTQGHDRAFAKTRGYNLQPEEKSFVTIWSEVTKHREKVNN